MLDPANQIPMAVFLIVQDQLIMGPNGAVAINNSALREEIARVVTDKEEQEIVFARVKAAHSHMLKVLKDNESG